MTIEAVVQEDGTLVIRVPYRYKGKRVRLSIREAETAPMNQWEQLQHVFQLADGLEIQRRSHDEILQEIREFRESV